MSPGFPPGFGTQPGQPPHQWAQGAPRNVTAFTPDEKKIFQYQGVWYDPLEITAKLQMLLGGRAEQMIRDYRKRGNAGPEGWAAFEQVKQAIHAVFEFEPFDKSTGQGTLYEVWDGAVEAYLDFFRKSATSTGTTPTSAPPTVSQGASPAASPTETITVSG